MKLQALRAFHTVMEARTVTAAARQMGRTQPQVSRMIADLEADLGFPLFTRRRQRLFPTAEGKRFHREVERILSGMDHLDLVAEDIRGPYRERLRLLAQPHLAYTLLPEAISAFTAEHPAVAHALEIRSRDDLADWIAGHQFDLGFAPLPIDHSMITVTPLIEVPLLAALPPKSVLAERSPLRAEDLADIPFIRLTSSRPMRQRFDAFFASQPKPPLIHTETSNVFSACQLVTKGLGATLADPFILDLFPPDQLTVRRVDPAVSIPYGVLLPKDARLTRTAEQFIRTVSDTATRIVARVRPRL